MFQDLLKSMRPVLAAAKGLGALVGRKLLFVGVLGFFVMGFWMPKFTRATVGRLLLSL